MHWQRFFGEKTSETARETAHETARLPIKLPTELPAKLPEILPAELPAKLPVKLPTNLPVKLPTILSAKLPIKLPTNCRQYCLQTARKMPANLPAMLPAQLSVKLPTKLPTKLCQCTYESLRNKQTFASIMILKIYVFSCFKYLKGGGIYYPKLKGLTMSGSVIMLYILQRSQQSLDSIFYILQAPSDTKLRLVCRCDQIHNIGGHEFVHTLLCCLCLT
jgi:hypothetical protein